MDTPSSSSSSSYCAVVGCSSTSTTHTMFLVPKQQVQRSQWCALVGRNALHRESSVCERHFEPLCFAPSVRNKAKKLLSNAKPSLYLPPPGNAIPASDASSVSPASSASSSSADATRRGPENQEAVPSVTGESSLSLALPSSSSEPQTAASILLPTGNLYDLSQYEHPGIAFCALQGNYGSAKLDLPGMLEDSELLMTTFNKLGFKNKILRDLSKKDIQTAFQNFCSQDLSPYAMAIVVLSGHGAGENSMELADKQLVSTSDFIEPLMKHPGMSGKVIWGIFELCRGSGREKNVLISPQPSPLMTRKVMVGVGKKVATLDEPSPRSAPSSTKKTKSGPPAELLCTYSTHPGLVSFSDADEDKKGSWLLRHLSSELLSWGGTRSLFDVLTSVTRAVVTKEVAGSDDEEDEEGATKAGPGGGNYGSTPLHSSQLTKSVYWSQHVVTPCIEPQYQLEGGVREAILFTSPPFNTHLQDLSAALRELAFSVRVEHQGSLSQLTKICHNRVAETDPQVLLIIVTVKQNGAKGHAKYLRHELGADCLPSMAGKPKIIILVERGPLQTGSYRPPSLLPGLPSSSSIVPSSLPARVSPVPPADQSRDQAAEEEEEEAYASETSDCLFYVMKQMETVPALVEALQRCQVDFEGDMWKTLTHANLLSAGSPCPSTIESSLMKSLLL